MAVTDHHVIDIQRIRSLQSLGAERLTVFPGIELRSELEGEETVHLIGIFSETADPEHIWTKLQGQLELTAAEVQKRGDDRVYVRFEQAAELIHELDGIVSLGAGMAVEVAHFNDSPILGKRVPCRNTYCTHETLAVFVQYVQTNRAVPICGLIVRLRADDERSASKHGDGIIGESSVGFWESSLRGSFPSMSSLRVSAPSAMYCACLAGPDAGVQTKQRAGTCTSCRRIDGTLSTA